MPNMLKKTPKIYSLVYGLKIAKKFKTLVSFIVKIMILLTVLGSRDGNANGTRS